MDTSSDEELLRERYQALAQLVIDGANESNMCNLLESLQSVCVGNMAIFVPITPGSEVQTREFSCWLLTYLMRIKGSPRVHDKGAALHTSILSLINTRRHQDFEKYLTSYIHIGNDVVQYLQSGTPEHLKCFDSFFKAPSKFVPRTLCLKKCDDANRLLETIVKVFGNLAANVSYHPYFKSDYGYQLFCKSIIFGDEAVRSETFVSIAAFLKWVGLPSSIEDQALLFKLIRFCLKRIQDDVINDDILGIYGTNLSKLICALHCHIGSFNPEFGQQFLSTFSDVYQHHKGVDSFQGELLKEISSFSKKLISHFGRTLEASQMVASLEKMADANMNSLIILETTFEHLIFDELNLYRDSFWSGNAHKRKINESIDDRTPVASISTWWRRVVALLEATLQELNTSDKTDAIKHLQIIASTFQLVSNICLQMSPEQTTRIRFFEESILSTLLQYFESVFTQPLNKDLVLKVLQVIYSMSVASHVTGSIFTVYNVDFGETCLAIASLPWVSKEKSLVRRNIASKMLKCMFLSKVVSAATKTAWTKDEELMAISIRILSVMPKHLCADWRIAALEAIIKDPPVSVIPILIECMPWMLLSLHSPKMQDCIQDVIKIFLDQNNPDCLMQMSTIFSHLFCAFAGAISIKRLKMSDVLPNLECRICSKEDRNIKRYLVDKAEFIKLFLHLLNHPCTDIVVNLTKSIGHIFKHFVMTASTFDKFLSLVNHNSSLVTDYLGNSLVTILEQSNDEVYIKVLKFLENIMDSPQTAVKGHYNCLKIVDHLIRKNLIRFSHKLFMIIVKALVNASDELVWYGQLLTRRLCKALNVSHRTFYLKHKTDAGPVIASRLRLMDVMYMMKILAENFSFDGDSHKNDVERSLARFSQSQAPYILPALVVRAARDNQIGFLADLARCINTRLADMLIDNFQFIIAYLVMNGTEDEKNHILTFISTITDIEIEDIRKCCIQHQVHELVLGLCDNEEAVMKEFFVMKILESNVKPRGKRDVKRDVREFLSERILGIIGFLDGKITSNSTSLSEKQRALRSLSTLFKIVGSHCISPVARKILSSLKTSLSISHLIEDTMMAWKTYLESLDGSALETLVEEIVIILMPHAKAHAQILAPVLETVLLASPNVKPLLHSMPLLPLCPEYSHINNVIREQSYDIDLADNGPSRGSDEDILHWLSFDRVTDKTIALHCNNILHGLHHESMEVRALYLRRLRDLLFRNACLIYQLTTTAERVDPLITELSDALLAQCKDNERDLHPVVAECLGLLGAIDPARFTTRTNKNGHELMFASWQSETFIVELVNELARAFLSANDNSSQTCASYALQEILRLYGVNAPSTRNATKIGLAVWSKLSPSVQQTVRPFHTSRYIITSNTNSAVRSSVPIYGSKLSSTFHDWLINWATVLVDQIHETSPKKIFAACKPILRRDTSTAMLLLPSILKQALIDNPSNYDDILTEILAVINDACSEKTADRLLPKQVMHLAMQMLFKIWDGLTQFVQKEKFEASTKKTSNKLTMLETFTSFLNKIPEDQLAVASFQCSAFSRALLHIESYLKKHPHQIRNQLNFLQTLYVALDEPDSVDGVAAIRGEEPCLRDQIIEYESTGRLHDAIGCYEKLSTLETCEKNYDGMLQCYLNLDQPHTVLNITNGLISKQPEMEYSLHEYRVEAAWKLGQWDLLDSYLGGSCEPSASWGIGIGQVLHAAINRDSEKYNKALRHLRTSQIAPISAARMDGMAYHRAYPYLIRLHTLNEIDEVVSGLLKLAKPWTDTASDDASCDDFLGFSGTSSITFSQLNDRWAKRISFVQPSVRFLEPLLTFRRLLLKLAEDWTKETNAQLSNDLSKKIEEIWLESAKVARKANRIEQGERAFLGAGHGRSVLMERAKWYWLKGEKHQAVITLKRGIDKYYPDAASYKGDTRTDTLPQRMECAQVKLLLAKYSEESATIDSNQVRAIYKEICDINKHWEDGHFNLAMYYDRLLRSRDDHDQPAEWIVHVVLSFGKSLSYGSKHLYHSMPRLLSLWMDFGAKVAKAKTSVKSQSDDALIREKLTSLNAFMKDLREKLPAYMFLTALPQLISRICHSHTDVFHTLAKLIAHLLSVYPQQSMWHLIAVSKSSYNQRAKRCLSVFERTKMLNQGLSKLITDSLKLADLLLELSNKSVVKGTTTTTMATLLKALPRLLSDPNFSEIIVPLQHLMTVTLPSNTTQSHSIHDPFPSARIYISGIEDEVDIMQSLQQPKKIILRGSDGNKYTMMCKPKDDLRKDCRLMEFNSFINRLLMIEPESRKRDLHIRTYAVIPLNDECGLLEWVANLNGLRQIIHAMYKINGCYTRGSELKAFILAKGASFEKKRSVFLNHLLPKHPAVLHQWFLKTFPQPQSWFRARVSYCRTTALMSMVGYILGLGDRHGENILIDSSNGDCVHVDFNCLFNKGETFDWPEKVPFRLTHNMLSAMGPTGAEGMYRKACEVTIRVMRNEKEALMSILQPFIYDPLVEWQRGDSNAKATGEINNAKAQLHVQDIECRLNGQIRNGRGINPPLSVEGQVNYLIDEATSITNLCQMYIGWGAFM